MADPSPPPSPMRSVQLPAELVTALEERFRGTSFDSVDAFIAFVLARLLDEPGTTGFSEEEERSLKERLRSLGYID
ncbi:MAG TPA: CopG family transcriptional regulator [Thermoplasmata archaeon]